ncbi:MAG: tetratricopeptide repeat protein [Candidatus Heimdallarchaeota archaeon]
MQQIEKMINHGEFEKANKQLSGFGQKGGLTKETVLGIKIIKVKSQKSSSWVERMEIIEQVIEELDKMDNPLLLNEALFVKALCFREVEKHDEAIEILEEAEKLLEQKLTSNDVDYKLGISRILAQKGECYNFSGRLDLSLKVLNQSLAIAKSLNEKNLLNKIYIQLGANFGFRANYKESLMHLNNCLSTAKKNKNKYQIANSYSLLAQLSQMIGKYEEAIKYIEQSIELYKEIGLSVFGQRYTIGLNYYFMGEINKSLEIFREVIPDFEATQNPRSKCFALWMKAIIDWHSGSIEKAVEYLYEGIEISNANNDTFISTLLSISLSAALNDKGEYDKALEIGRDSFKIFKQYNNIWTNSFYYESLGKIYYTTGNFNLAMKNAKTSLQLRKKIPWIKGMVHSLFLLVIISIDKNDVISYNMYLEELKNLVESNLNPYFVQIARISQALVLKASTRPRDWMKALDILESIADEEPENKNYAIIALNNLCELLMIEFSISGDVNVLEELEEHIERLEKIAKSQNNYALRLEAANIQILTLWLKAQFSMADLDIQNARNLLLETRVLADKEGLFKLAEKMNQQQEKLLGQVSLWDDFIRKYYEFIKE